MVVETARLKFRSAKKDKPGNALSGKPGRRVKVCVWAKGSTDAEGKVGLPDVCREAGCRGIFINLEPICEYFIEREMTEDELRELAKNAEITGPVRLVEKGEIDRVRNRLLRFARHLQTDSI